MDLINIKKCNNCEGSGYSVSNPIRCATCVKIEIYGCVRCMSGYIKSNYETCTICKGYGTVNNTTTIVK